MTAVDSPVGFTTTSLARLVNAFLGRDALSYRQLDYWVRGGFEPELLAADGSGSRRAWSVNDARIVLAVTLGAEVLSPKAGLGRGGRALTSDRIVRIVELLRAHHDGGAVVMYRDRQEWISGGSLASVQSGESFAFLPVLSLLEAHGIFMAGAS